MAAHKWWRLSFPNDGRAYVTLQEVVWRDASNNSLNAGASVAASSYYSTGYLPSNLLDGNSATPWANATSAFPAWVAFLFPSEVEPASVDVLCGPAPELPGVPTCSYGDEPSFSGESPAMAILSGSIAANTWVKFEVAGPWTPPLPIVYRDFLDYRSAPVYVRPPVSARNEYFQRSANLYFGGRGKIYGYVDKDQSPDDPVPLRRKVVLHRMRDNVPVAVTVSREGDGYYEFPNLDEREKYYAVAFDHLEEYRMVGADNLLPEVS